MPGILLQKLKLFVGDFACRRWQGLMSIPETLQSASQFADIPLLELFEGFLGK